MKVPISSSSSIIKQFELASMIIVETSLNFLNGGRIKRVNPKSLTCSVKCTEAWKTACLAELVIYSAPQAASSSLFCAVRMPRSIGKWIFYNYKTIQCKGCLTSSPICSRDLNSSGLTLIPASISSLRLICPHYINFRIGSSSTRWIMQ